MIKNYLVSSAGRSGCHLTVSLIESSGMRSIHTHDPFFHPEQFGDPTGADSVIVLLERKDLFAAIMSMLIGKRTRQWFQYNNVDFEPFILDCQGEESEFAHQYAWHKNYVASCTTLKNFSQVEHLYYEEIIQDFDYVFKKLGITQIQTPILPQKAPYTYVDKIINVEECRSVFDQLEKNYKFSPILKAYDPNFSN